MASLKDVGERTLVRNVSKHLRSGRSMLGPGDDAACVDVNGQRIISSTDIVTFRHHMPRGMTMEQFGWMAAAVNLSDIASMGARPIGFLAALALPEEMDEQGLYDIMNGMDQCAEFCGTEVIGGDTKTGHGVVCGTALGVVEGKLLTRYGARPGDMVAVTGTLGSAAAGWYAIQNNIVHENAISSLLLPIPRVEEGMILSRTGIATSCMDISDGLSTSAHSICEMSGVGMDILWESLPKGDGVEKIAEEIRVSEKDLMLNFGGEYELLFTLKKEDVRKLESEDMNFSVIGTVTEDSGKVTLIENTERTPMENRGYEHFTR